MPGSAIDLDEGTPLLGFLTCWLSRAQEKMNAQATRKLREDAGPYPTPSRISAMVGGENETEFCPYRPDAPLRQGAVQPEIEASRRRRDDLSATRSGRPSRAFAASVAERLAHPRPRPAPQALVNWRSAEGEPSSSCRPAPQARASTGPPGKSGTCGDRNAVSNAGKARDRRRMRCVRSMTSPKRKTACDRDPSCFLACQSARIARPRTEEIGKPRRAPDNLETVPKRAANGA